MWLWLGAGTSADAHWAPGMAEVTSLLLSITHREGRDLSFLVLFCSRQIPGKVLLNPKAYTIMIQEKACRDNRLRRENQTDI